MDTAGRAVLFAGRDRRDRAARDVRARASASSTGSRSPPRSPSCSSSRRRSRCCRRCSRSSAAASASPAGSRGVACAGSDRDAAAGVLGPLDRADPATPGGRGGGGDAADAAPRGAGALAAARLERRRERPDLVHDPPRLRPARAGFGPGFNGPLSLVVELPRHGRHGRRSGGSRPRSRQTPDVASVAPPRLSPAGAVATISAYPGSSPQSSATTTLVKQLRGTRDPAARAGDRRDGLRRRRDRDVHRLLERPLEQALALHRRRRRPLGAAPARRLPLAPDPAPGRADEPALDRRLARGRRRLLPVRLAAGDLRRARSTRSCRC